MAAAQGYAVCVNYKDNAAAARSVVEQIVSAGGHAIAIAANVADENEVSMMFDTAIDELGPIRALVNNAGILETQTDFLGIDLQRFKRVIDTNLIGAFNCMQAAIRRMSVERGGAGGAIVNVSSVAARTGAAHEYIDYAASKGALDAMTAGVAQEAAPLGIRVNTVRPGFIYTEMHASGGEPGRVDRLAKDIPLQRGGSPDDVARVIMWFISDQARYAVGASLDVTGGV